MLPEYIINLIQSFVTDEKQCCFFHDTNHLEIVAVSSLQNVLLYHKIKIICLNQYEWCRGYSITYKSNEYQDYAES